MKKILLSTYFMLFAIVAMAQNYTLTQTKVSSSELMERTQSTLIAIKNLSATNNYYFVGNTNATPYSAADFSDAAVFVWEPVTEGVAGSYYIKKLDGTYMQTSAPKDFGEIDGAAVFTTTNPTLSAGADVKKEYFNGDGDSHSYIEGNDDPNMVRFVNSAGKWINVQNGNSGTPTYNEGTGGWTIHYVYEVHALYTVNNTKLTAAALNEKTEPTLIAMKNLSRTNFNWFTGGVSTADLTEIFVWEPANEGRFYLKKLSSGEYLQSNSYSFGTIDNAATFRATNPTASAGTFNSDNDSKPYIENTDDPNMVRFENNSGSWINVQGAAGTPTYNTGTGGWTIQYVYEVTEAIAYKATITDAKYATFFAINECKAPEDVKVYYATAENVSNGVLHLTEIESKIIPANTGVILQSETTEDYEFALVPSNTNAVVNNNILKGSPVNTNIIGDAYVLAKKDNVVGLYLVVTEERESSDGIKAVFENNAGKAYLPASAVPATTQKSFVFDFEGTTNIDKVIEHNDNKVYDLMGREVKNPTSGVYIINGKKRLIK